MISALSYSSSALADLTTILNDFHGGLVSLRQGRLSYKIINPDILLNLIGSLTLNNLRPIWPAANQYVPAYYKYISIIPVNSKLLCFFMAIPLLGEPEIELKLYRVNALPYPISEDAVVSFGSLPKYFAVSPDRSLYIEVDDLNQCKKFRQTYVCPILTDISKENFKTCTYSLFTSKNISTNCGKHLSGPLDRPKLVSDTSGGWLYATSKTIEITITCPSGTQTQIVKIGVGKLNIGPQCKVSSRYSIIPASYDYRSDKNITKNFLEEFSLELTKVEKTKIIKISKDPVFQDLISLTGNNVPLKSLKGDLSKLNTIESNRVKNTHASNAALVLSVLALVGLSGILGLGIFLVCEARKDQRCLGAPRAPLAAHVLLAPSGDHDEILMQNMGGGAGATPMPARRGVAST